jgi:hypothetical protein
LAAISAAVSPSRAKARRRDDVDVFCVFMFFFLRFVW